MASSLALSIALSVAAGAVDGVVTLRTFDDVTDIEGTWLFAPGDDPGYASPSLDDSRWQRLVQPLGIGKQGHEALVGHFWLRLHVRAPAPARMATTQLALQIFDFDSAYELYADGVRVGGFGSVVAPYVDDHAHTGIWSLPNASFDDGELVLAIRGYRTPLRQSAAPARGGIVHGPLLLGPTATLTRELFISHADEWLLLGSFIVVGLYHLQLFRRRRELREYLWFGLFSLAISSYIASQLPLAHDVVDGTTLRRVWWLSLSGAIFAFVQFLWPFLRRPIGRHWRAWQAVVAVWCALGVLWPSAWLIDRSLLPWEIVVVVPLLIGGAWLIARRAWQGDPEARTIALGFIPMALTVVNNISRTIGFHEIPEFTNWAFLAFVLAMAASLSNRFTRMHEEVDALLAKTLQLSKLKDEFLANTSHELRTPLNAIINIPRALLDEMPARDVVVCRSCASLFEPDEQDGDGAAADAAAVAALECPSCAKRTLAVERRRVPLDDADAVAGHLQSVVRSGEHLLAVVTDILDASKIAAGGMELSRARVMLGDVVARAVETVQPQATERGVVVNVRVPGDIALSADRTRLTQVVINLVANAVAFSKAGGAVDVEARLAAGTVELRVVDGGVGIAPENHALIFEAFRQVDAGHTRKHGGTGLGLAIAKQLVELHGGAIRVESALGQGATFIVTLPTAT